jgi:repressor LexA
VKQKATQKREHRDRSDEVLAYINDCNEKGRPPTEREIMTAVGLHSPSAVDYYVRKLKTAGKLIRIKKSSRGLSLKSASKRQSPTSTIQLPGLGNIAAGIPIMVPGQDKMGEAALFEVEIPESYIPAGISPREVFALRVDGDSMRDAMIQDGDTVLVYKTQNVRNGDIVAAWLLKEHTTTLKRVRFTTRGIWLEPENPSSAFPKSFYLPEEIDIQGKVLGVLRLYR